MKSDVWNLGMISIGHNSARFQHANQVRQAVSICAQLALLDTSLILFLLTFDLLQCPNGTALHQLTLMGIDDKHILARLMLFFNVQWGDIFNKQVPQSINYFWWAKKKLGKSNAAQFQ